MLRNLILGAALALPATAQASDARMHEAFRRAIDIVRTQSDYKKIPPVRFWVKVPELGMGRMAMRYEAAGDHRNVVAMYVCAEKAMYLSESLDPDDPEQLGVVVHEMVHHAQCEAGRFTIDLCQAEREAYRIQAAYHRSLVASSSDRRTSVASNDTMARALEAASDAACAAARNR